MDSFDLLHLPKFPGNSQAPAWRSTPRVAKAQSWLLCFLQPFFPLPFVLSLLPFLPASFYLSPSFILVFFIFYFSFLFCSFCSPFSCLVVGAEMGSFSVALLDLTLIIKTTQTSNFQLSLYLCFLGLGITGLCCVPPWQADSPSLVFRRGGGGGGGAVGRGSNMDISGLIPNLSCLRSGQPYTLY